jgi:hypothetical protein
MVAWTRQIRRPFDIPSRESCDLEEDEGRWLEPTDQEAVLKTK